MADPTALTPEQMQALTLLPGMKFGLTLKATQSRQMVATLDYTLTAGDVHSVQHNDLTLQQVLSARAEWQQEEREIAWEEDDESYTHDVEVVAVIPTATDPATMLKAALDDLDGAAAADIFTDAPECEGQIEELFTSIQNVKTSIAALLTTLNAKGTA